MEGSWVQKTAYDIVMHVIRQLTGDLSNQAWNWFSEFFSSPVAMLDHPLVQRLTQIAIGLGLGFLPVAVAWIVLRETLARLDGSSTTPPESVIRRAMITGCAVTATSTVAGFLGTLAELGRELLQAFGLDLNLIEIFFKMPLEPGVVALVITLMFAIGTVILCLQRIVIAAEFTILLVIGPLMALGLIREQGSTTWNIWLRELLSLLVTPVLQMLVLLIFVRNWANAAGFAEVGARFASLGFLWVLWNTPRWARQMIYQAGAGGAVIGGAANVGRLVVMRQLIRATVTKV